VLDDVLELVLGMARAELARVGVHRERHGGGARLTSVSLTIGEVMFLAAKLNCRLLRSSSSKLSAIRSDDFEVGGLRLSVAGHHGSYAWGTETKRLLLSCTRQSHIMCKIFLLHFSQAVTEWTVIDQSESTL
jgi:hypothetical protein